MNKIIKFLALGGIVWLCAEYMDGISIIGGYKYALIAAIVLAIVNTFIRPILAILSFPITIVTFGLFSFVLTAGSVMIMDYFVDSISIASFWWALALGVIISFAGSTLDKILNADRKLDHNRTRGPQINRPHKKNEEFSDYQEVD
ncbi:phage holin family protein [Bacteroidia bacterium]|nr:phage holin family protein [Bacteroidia bacterium]MDB9883215.1 phage holin family protein [Bacteroidia bacterium]